jgi:glutathione S-transferase
MKLYYAQGTCSLAPHISLREAGLPFQLVRYDMTAQALEDGAPLRSVNEKGYVPVLELDGGERLTEVSAILQYIADQRPDGGLAPKAGSLERYRLQEWLNFLATELHKSFWPFFHEGCDAEKPNQSERLVRRLGWLDAEWGDKAFLLGAHFTVADAYLYTMLNWVRPAGFDLGRWPKLERYRARMKDRPAVRAAVDAERPPKKAAVSG